MSRSIEGALVTPEGAPMAGFTIGFRSLVTTPGGVPRGESVSTVTNSLGAYAITLLPGSYAVTLTPPSGSPVSRLGRGIVTTGAPITLPQLVRVNELPPSVFQALADRVTALESDDSGTSLTPGPGFRVVGSELRHDIQSLPRG